MLRSQLENLEKNEPSYYIMFECNCQYLHVDTIFLSISTLLAGLVISRFVMIINFIVFLNTFRILITAH